MAGSSLVGHGHLCTCVCACAFVCRELRRQRPWQAGLTLGLDPVPWQWAVETGSDVRSFVLGTSLVPVRTEAGRVRVSRRWGGLALRERQ